MVASMAAARLCIGKQLLCAGSRAAQGAGISRQRFSTEVERVTSDILKKDGQGIAVIGLERPMTKNALSRSFVRLLRDTLRSVQADKDVRAVIIKSNVDRVFCAGADLKERLSMTPSEARDMTRMLRETFMDIELLPMPTIAAINGAALGGGLELALACDIRLAGPAARLGLPESRLAIIPGAGGTQRLPRLVGVAKAKELIFTARVLSADEAQAIGLVNYAVSGDPYEKAMEMANEILPSGPVAVTAAKQAINKGFGQSSAESMAVEDECYGLVIPTQDRLEGLAAFQQKRKPKYTGH